MIRKANCLFASFPGVGPAILSRLFLSYCLSLYGSCLWSLSSPALRNIEVAFNKILRKIWHLHYRSHTAIVHLFANLPRLFNVVFHRCVILCVLLRLTVLPLWFVLFSVTLLLIRTLFVVIIPCMVLLI